MKLKLLDPEFKSRLYQELIAETAIKKNTICILPTGLGKTYIAILVAAYRLEKNPGTKILMMAPTRPLVNQHFKTFKKYLIAKKDEFVALTGKIQQGDRKVFYQRGKLFFATPQLIRNDIKDGILDPKNFSLIVVDECHRAVGDYAYTDVIQAYVETNLDPLILGLTASPGGIRDRIEEVKENLHAEKVEIRTEKDGDVEPYVQETEVEKIFVKLPEEFEKIKENLEKVYNQKIYDLVRVKAIPSPKVSKKDLLTTQRELGKMYSETKDYQVVKALLSCAQAIKVGHAIELIETQGITALKRYLTKLTKDKKSSASKKLVKHRRIQEAIKETEKLHEKGKEHPKLEKLLEIIRKEIKKNKYAKIIVFANYRDSVTKIKKLLEKNGIEAKEFYGQAKKRGKSLSQKEQIEIINEFGLEIFNVLVATSVAEEGLSIPAVDLVIFYEPVPSEIRTIQRRGRTGRTESGRVIFLITKDTRDEWYYWSAYHKEKRMKKILKGLKEGNSYKSKKTIKDFVS
jgi:Fanconi anemia group M protein